MKNLVKFDKFNENVVSSSQEELYKEFKKVANDPSKVEDLLKKGLNPNYSQCAPLRVVIKGSYVSPDNIGESYFETFKVLVKYGLNVSGEHKDSNLKRQLGIRFSADFARFDIMDYIDKNYDITKQEWEHVLKWTSYGKSNLKPDVKNKVIKYLEEKIKSFDEKTS